MPKLKNGQRINNVVSKEQMMDLLHQEGWRFDESNGSSHKQYEHPIKKGKVTLKNNIKEYSDGILISMLRQMGLK